MAAIDVQLTARPTVEITHQNVFVGGVVTEQINGVTIGTVVSGTTNNQVIENTLGTPVGTAANPSVVPDATVQLNGTTVGTIPSWDSDSFTVNLNGSPSGVWDGTAWQVTSAPCNDATIELNGVEMTTIPSGDTENISIRQSSGATEVGSKQGVHWRIDDSAISINGSPVADVKAEDALDIDVTQDGSPVGSWNGSAWIVPPSIVTSLSIEVYSDAGYTTPASSFNYGATAYIKLTPTGITPTTHTLFFGNGTKNAPQVTQVGNTLAWVVSLDGTVTISATATDGTDATADATPFTLTSTIVITNSMKFDGVNDTTLATPLISYNQDFSVSFWFKMNSAAITNSLFSMGIKYNSSRLAITVFYNIDKIAVLSSGTGWNLNRNVAWTGNTNWHNLIVTNNNSTKAKEVFIDGVSIGIPNNDTLSADFDYLMLGYGFGNTYGNVNIADFNIHNSILTAPQIAALQTVGATSANSVQRWIFNEAVGTTSGAVTDIVAGQKMNLRNMLAPNGIVADAP